MMENIQGFDLEEGQGQGWAGRCDKESDSFLLMGLRWLECRVGRSAGGRRGRAQGNQCQRETCRRGEL